MTSPVSVAPMMDWTDRHCRYFMRLLNPDALLYTEMVTAAAVHHGDAQRLLAFDPAEHPVALQLGGSDPRLMAEAARAGAEFGYDEININVGCPSDRVQSGQFGACLMAKPEVVANCFRAMQGECDVPVTVKSRIGIDDQDSEEFLRRFVDVVAAAGCEKFIVHARIAILEGLSPKENRSVPPLNYPRVFRLKQLYPDLSIVINGGLTDVAGVEQVLQHVDGAMIGRQAYQQPYFLAELAHHCHRRRPLPDRRDVVRRMQAYADTAVAAGESLHRVTRHLLGLFAGQPGARAWRRYLSEHAHRAGAGPEILADALKTMSGGGKVSTMRRPTPGNLEKETD